MPICIQHEIVDMQEFAQIISNCSVKRIVRVDGHRKACYNFNKLKSLLEIY